jgi:uncharacterized protein (TIGR02099 family)
MSSLPILRPAARVIAGALFAAWSVALVAWLTLHWGILPRLDGWRPQIEQRLGSALGVPVSIGRISVRSGGWVPAFTVEDVRLLDAQGRVGLALGRVSAALSPSSLWALEPRFAQLHLEGVSLDVRRDAAGRLHVAGLDLGGGAPAAGGGDRAWLDTFLRQHEFVVRAGTLRWTDETRDAPPLTLQDVDLVVRNGGRRHQLRLDATPPADWGRRFALRGQFTRPLTARPSALERWQGELYAELPEADVSQLRRHLALPFALTQGRGALRAWVDWAGGQPVRATVDLALAAVELRLGDALPPLALAQLRGRVQGRQDAAGLALEVQQLGFVTDAGEAWAPTTLQLALRRAPTAGATADAGPWAGGELRLDRLSLAPLARLAARLPLPPAAHAALADLDPQGELSALALDWTGPPQAPLRYRASAQMSALALSAGPPGPPAWGLPQTAGRPGLRGAALSLEATERGGQARLAIADGAVVFPGVFEQPELPLDSAQADLVWTLAPGAGGMPPAVVLEVRDAQAANADVALRFDGRWRTGDAPGFGVGQYLPGALALQGQILRGSAARVARYLPLGVAPEARAYVARAFTEGRITGGDVAVDGDLWRFPFVDGGPGTFRIRAQVEGVRYAFVPSEPGWTSPWPALAAVKGTLEFDRAAMRIRDAQAEVGGVALQGVAGGIEDLAEQRLLRLEGRARGALADMLRFVNATPVGDWTGGALAQAQATGAADLSLALTIPLPDPAAATVRGSVQLAGNDLRLRPDVPVLAALRGRVDFTERGLTVQPTRARALGGELAFDGGTQADGSLRFRGEGQATADGLLRADGLPWLAPLVGGPGRLRGQAAYAVQLDLRDGRPAWLVTSPLAGLALDLPAPLDKPAADAWPLRVQAGPEPAGRAAAEELRITLGERGERLQARLERSAESGAVVRAVLATGAALPPWPATGVAARASLPALDVDAWRAVLAPPPAPQAPSTAPATAAPLALPPGPVTLVLETDALRVGGRRLEQVALTLQRRAAGRIAVWRGEGRAREGEGWVEWQPADDARAAPRLRARLARLDLPEPAAPPAAGAAPAAEPAPGSLPALSLVIDDFRWRGRPLGRLELEAEQRAAAWQLDRLRLALPEATLTGRGQWSAGQRSMLELTLELADGGAFFERLGAGKGMLGAPGRIEGSLSWPGSPLSPSLARIDGRVRVALRGGRFLDAEPGVARLFGILSLQALPRRLLLDFRDVFQQGLAFDRIEGDIALAGGQARTDNLRVLGVQAAVLIEGRADLVQETQDLRIVAVPELNTAGASLAWAAINPAVGIGAFVAQLLLNKPVTAAATREFHVTGPWAEPKVERVERLASADGPGPANPASPPGPAGPAPNPP